MGVSVIQWYVRACQMYPTIDLLTKLRLRWNELNFWVRKYFGKMIDENSATLWIRKALPEWDHTMSFGWSGSVAAFRVSPSNISYKRRGNCCGTPRFPVRGKANWDKGLSVGSEIMVCWCFWISELFVCLSWCFFENVFSHLCAFVLRGEVIQPDCKNAFSWKMNPIDVADDAFCDTKCQMEKLRTWGYYYWRNLSDVTT